MKGKKILITICGITIVAAAIVTSLKDDIRVVSLSKQQYEESEVEVVDGDNFIKYVSDINNIKDIVWLNEDVVQFKCTDKESGNFKSLQFNYSKKLLSENNNSGKDNFYQIQFKEKIEFVKAINQDNYVIYTEGKDKRGLFHVSRDKEPILLSSNIKVDDKLLFKISNNNNKIAYYDKNEDMIKVYNFNNRKAVEIEEGINSEIFKDFKNYISFSYEDGYIAVANVNRENFKESNFSVYGADSGKAYAENLLGMNPVWGKNNLIISFTYLEDNSITNTKNKKSIDIVGDRVGLFNLKTRKTKFIEDMGEKYKVIKPTVWINDKEIIISVGKYSKDENLYLFNKIYSYSLANNMLANLEGYFKDVIEKGNDFQFITKENYLYTSFYCNEQENTVKVIDMNSRDEKDFENLQVFNIDKEENNKGNLFRSLAENKFLYVHNNGVYMSDLKSNHIKYKTDGTILKVYESPNKSNLFIISELGEKLELAIVKL